MATRMGAPGVRIELHDRSGYSLVETPNAVGGVVGFAPKGELNKIQLLTNTAEQDTYFGLGFNNSRYNQGMYGARAVINAGGHVEFVRPYGEEIDKTDDRKRDLKTDTYVVAFDRDAVKNDKNRDHASIKVEYFASTRYKTDGAARYGATRKINNVAETITNGDNVNFNLDAAEDYTDEANWVTTGKGGVARGETDMVMFAIMNRDPSSANRAYSSYKCSLKSDDERKNGEIKVTCTSKVGFAIDDIVYGPAKGFTKGICRFRVTNIVEKDVSLKADDDYTTDALQKLGYSPDVLIYSDLDNAIADGYDYLTVKTAVTGRGVKTFGSLRLDSDVVTALKNGGSIVSGSYFTLSTQSGTDVYVRLDTPNNTTGSIAPKTQGSYDKIVLTLSSAANADSIWVGDVLQLEVSTNVAMYKVTGADATNISLEFESSSMTPSALATVFGEPEAEVVVKNFAQNWVDGVDTYVLSVTDKSTLSSITTDLVTIMKTANLGYTTASVLGDIKVDATTGKIVISEDKRTLTMVDGAAVEFVPGDTVAITRGSVDLTKYESTMADSAAIKTLFDASNILYVGMVKNSDPINNVIELADAIPNDMATLLENTDIKFQLLNLTQTNKTVITSLDTVNWVSNDKSLTLDSLTEDDWELVSEGSASEAPKYRLIHAKTTALAPANAVDGDMATFTCGNQTATASVKIKGEDPNKYLDFNLKSGDDKKNIVVAGTHDQAGDHIPSGVTLTGTIHVSADDREFEYSDIYLVSNFDTSVPADTQATRPEADFSLFGSKYDYAYYAKGDSHIVDKSEKVLTDSTIGGTFVGLGLARIQYMDVNFTGDTVRVYDLTEEGEAVARLYISVAYMYNGIRYEFDGTVVPYVYNDMQLYIGDTAENELEGSGAMFVLNDSGVMELFREDNSYDLSATVAMSPEGIISPCGSVTCPAFNEKDPAIINDAVWTYDPSKNMSTSTLSNAFNLFLDKDKSDVTFFVGAGLGVNNFGLKGYETLNTQLMQAILSICELRKDCFALFDGVADSRINQTLKLDSPASRFGSALGRWGAIYDARPIFFDSIVTKTNVEIAPSIAMASLITANRRGSIWWYPPAGEDTGMIPGAWCRKVKYERRFNIPEDTESDIAKLCDIHVNPFRTNKKGIYCYGDFTMQMEDTAFNAINVTMLVAGIHKMYYNYLDSRVFRINTPTLRAQITTDLQGELDKIIGENPAGLETGSYVLCDDTNNPPEVVEAHKLYVDLMLYPTTTSRYIFLRTNVLSKANGNVISTELTTGNRQ